MLECSLLRIVLEFLIDFVKNWIENVVRIEIRGVGKLWMGYLNLLFMLVINVSVIVVRGV